MSASKDINRLMKQTERYWYEDGFQDMGFGVFILLIGLLFVGETLTRPAPHYGWSGEWGGRYSSSVEGWSSPRSSGGLRNASPGRGRDMCPMRVSAENHGRSVWR